MSTSCCNSVTDNNSKQYSNARSLLASTFYLASEEAAISAANYNYNHYNLPFSHIIIIVTISDEDMLKTENTLKTLKKRKCVLCIKKMVGKEKVTTDLLIFFQICQKFRKGVCMIRSTIFLKISLLDINADFVSVSIPKMHFFPW